MTKLVAPNCVLEKLLCATCKNYLSVFPVYTHVDGIGAICGRCKITDVDKYIHDGAYENIAQFLIFSCHNKADGCKENLTPHTLEEHERTCAFRKLDCPTRSYSKCQWQGPRIDLNQHFSDKHSGLLLKDGKFELSFVNSYKENALLPVGANLFIVKKEVDSRTEKFLCSVQHIRSGDNPEYYKYCLRLVSGDKKYSCKFAERNTFDDDNTTKVDGSFVKEKLNDPASIIGSIEIIKANQAELDEPTMIKDIKKDPNINWELLSELECPICYDFMLPPIYQCIDGHSICSECKPKIAACPLCQKGIKDTKNFSLEKMTQYLTFPCKFYKTGCTYSSKSTEIKKHEDNCEYGPYKCPLSEVETCQCKFNSSQIIEHVENNHEAFILKSERINIVFKKDENSVNFYLIKFSEKIFKLHYKYENNKFYWAVQLVGPAKECEKFKFEIDVNDNSGNKLRRYSKGLCVPLTENDVSFNDARKYLTMTFEEIEPLITTTFSYRVRVLKE